jgi:hypothetical protein
MMRSLSRRAQASRLAFVHVVIPVPGTALHFQAVVLRRLVSRADPRQATVTRHSGRSREARHQRGVGIPPRRIRLVHAGPPRSSGLKAHVSRPCPAGVDVVEAGGDVTPVDHFDSLLRAGKLVRCPLDECIGDTSSAHRGAAGHHEGDQRANPRAQPVAERHQAAILDRRGRRRQDRREKAEPSWVPPTGRPLRGPSGDGPQMVRGTSTGRSSRRRRRMFLIRYPTITRFRTNKITRPTRTWCISARISNGIRAAVVTTTSHSPQV